MADDGSLTLRSGMLEELREAARERGYGSPEELLRGTLDEWKRERDEAQSANAKLKSMIQVGLDDIAAGRVTDFDADEIIREARDRRASRCA